LANKGSNEDRESSERAPSDVSLPFLNTLNLTKTNSQEQRKTVGIVGFNPASVQANKPNTRFFAAGNEFINPRLSEDNQSGASVDSANRKRRMITINPIEYLIVYDSLKEKRDSTEHDSEITKKNSIKMNARLKVLRPTSKESNGSNGNTSKQSIRSVQASDQVDNMSRNTSIQSLGQKLHGKINTFERRYQRPVECHSPLLIGQNTTVHQQAKQKQDIEKRLNKVMINPSENSGKVHLPKLGKPFDRASRDGGTKSEINQG
jgi:hypothetical protein